jgi:hypothetical protein
MYSITHAQKRAKHGNKSAGIQLFVCLLLLVAVSGSVSAQSSANEDLVLVIRQTPVYASLELYADILFSAQEKQIYPVLDQLIDQHGLDWYKIRTKDGIEGYLSDAILLRIERAALSKIADRIDISELARWDQSLILSLHSRPPETGISTTQLLLMFGEPEEIQPISDMSNWSFPSYDFLVKDDVVSAFLQKGSAGKQRKWTISNFSLSGEGWSRTGTKETAIANFDGDKGECQLLFVANEGGRYLLSTAWSINRENSASVRYIIEKNDVAEDQFLVNQRLYNGATIPLGVVDLEKGESYLLRIFADDQQRFAVGPVTFEYLQEIN